MAIYLCLPSLDSLCWEGEQSGFAYLFRRLVCKVPSNIRCVDMGNDASISPIFDVLPQIISS